MRSPRWPNLIPTRMSILCLLSVLGCNGQAGHEGSTTARGRGEQAARADLARGILKQKEYPPMPYSLQQMNFIKLIKSECGVVWEVANAPLDARDVRDEVEGYNAVMRGEIQRKFGADIFQKLHDKAEHK